MVSLVVAGESAVCPGHGAERLDIKEALGLYREHRVTLSRAAELAGLSVRDLLVRLPDAGVELNYDLAELRCDLETA
ncbi:MAG: hypothetical protein A3K19_24270 [Lentisphaerae bacterium RIFOXYB12_FULL_65_16]|nr:MAG: hypothetical protein A3K18_32445 [Lentisphaerae bacterium RIFOXYA12_64_32]OGV87610.1 MAG: hypothetical protein A3K19_24270 [Lentisphaerae bacterium RIFOXYB12_FULL_65_16]